jgi:hypothetical protein
MPISHDGGYVTSRFKPVLPLTPMSSDLNPTKPPELTTLESLQCYTPRQTQLIKPYFSHRYRFQHPSGFDASWAGIFAATWGKVLDSDKTEKVERGSDPIDDPLVPNDRDVMLIPQFAKDFWSFRPRVKKILIRSEYKEAEEFALFTCGERSAPDVLLVIGQSGIGLSPFYSTTTEY